MGNGYCGGRSGDDWKYKKIENDDGLGNFSMTEPDRPPLT